MRWNTSGSPTLQNFLFLVVILAALLLQRGKLSRAEESGTSSWSATAVLKPIPDELRRLPEVVWSKRVLLGLVAAAFLIVPNTFGPSNQFLAAVAIVWAMMAVSLVVLTGWGGHISLGQFAIVGVGALVAGNLISDHNTDLLLVLVASGVAGAVVSLLVGLPALRIKGLFLAVTTLALAVALDRYVINVNNFPSILPSGVERPLFLERIDLTDGYNMYVFCLAFLGLSILAAQGVRKARAGRVIIATRDNERAADAAAVPTTSGEAGRLHPGRASSPASPGGLHVHAPHQRGAGQLPALRLDQRVRHRRHRRARVGRRRRHRRAPVPLRRDDHRPRRHPARCSPAACCCSCSSSSPAASGSSSTTSATAPSDPRRQPARDPRAEPRGRQAGGRRQARRERGRACSRAPSPAIRAAS